MWTSFCGSGASARRRRRFLDERFGLAHRELLGDDVARDAQLRGFVGEAEQRARVAHRQRAGATFVAHLVRQLQQPQVVGDRRAILADRVGDLFLRQVELVDEPAIGVRLFDRIEILALDVLDQRHREQPVVGDVADDDRDLEQAGALRGAPAALAGDDLVAARRPCARRSAG